MPVRVAAETEKTLRELGKIRNSVNDEARNAISQYIASRVLNSTFQDEIAQAEDRFGRMLRAVTNPALVEREPGTPPQSLADGRQVSIRMDPTMQTQLMGLALIDDNSLADQVRSALDLYVTEQLGDASVQQALEVLRLLESIDISTTRR